MSNFKPSDFSIKEDNALSKAARVVKVSQPSEPQIQNFHFSDIKAEKTAPRSRSSRGMDQARDRFSLSELARDALSIGREEERMIEAKVAEQVAALSANAREEGTAQGYEEGKKRGEQEAIAKFQAEAAARLERIDALVVAMEGAKAELFEANREFLTNLIFRISKMVLLRELKTDSEFLLRLARELIEKTGLRENLTLKIHPGDAESVETLKAGIMQSYSGLKNLSVELSDHVVQGGCVLETEWGAIDASLETQLSQILKSLDTPNQGSTA